MTFSKNLISLPTSVIHCYGHNLVLEPCHQVQASHSQITLTFPTSFLYDSFNSKGISVQFSRSAVSDSFRPHGLQQARLSCISPSPRDCSDSGSLSQWCHPTVSPLKSSSHSAFNLSQHQGLFQWVSSSHQVAKGLELQLRYQAFQWIFRTDFF